MATSQGDGCARIRAAAGGVSSDLHQIDPTAQLLLEVDTELSEVEDGTPHAPS